MSKYKDKGGRFITQSLIIEHQYDPRFAIYTMRDEDFTYNGKVYPSLYRLYMEIADPTEYEFANTYFFNWAHWKKFSEAANFKRIIAKWREELEIKLKSEAIQEMRKKAKDPKGATAARWLAEKGWEEKRKAGAPSKEEKEHQMNIDRRVQEELDNDIKRMQKWH